MHILIAPDSFKESLSAAQVAEAINLDFQRFILMQAMTYFPWVMVGKVLLRV